ncbi:MAG: hypothetical protein HOW97_01520 [Catenulispora sp.]|nr:hypothetical protein [Catenulispora sp.]
MTENSNTPSDPNAGPPAGSAPGTPETPPIPQSPQTPSEPAPVPPAQTPQTPLTPQTPASSPGVAGTAGAAGATTGATEATAEDAWATTPAGADETLGADYGEPADPNAPNTGVAATFLPGIEAASVLALLTSLLAAGAYLLVYPLVQAHGAARTWSDFKNNVPRARQDPFGTERDWIQYQSWAHIILGLVAILLALFVLGLWTARRHRLYSRAFAQAALVLGLAVVLYGILLKTGVVGSEIPSMREIGGALSSQQ